ncbi:PAS domain S-box protein [Xanthobacter variabilis]|uniref:PAS domain S-box protein n=1 Tax=Xanthobacter variabilis TaxID=3119932 RepID=UPI003728D50C
MSQLSDSHYRTAFENASDAIFIHDPDDGQILEANETSELLTGYSRDELLTMTVAGISPPRKPFCPEQALRLIRRASEQGGSTFEWTILPRGGDELPVEVNLKVITVEGRRLVLALFRDIRERKLYEERLIAREAHFRRLIQHSSDGIAIVQPNGRLRYVSPSISTVLGYDERRATGRNVLDYIHPADIERVRLLLRPEGQSPADADGAQHVTYRILHRDGGWRHHEATVKNLLRTSEMEGILVNYRDVTERVEAERKARERERELEHVARCRSMGELASALAHELNQPFAAIGNYIGGCIHRLESGRFDPDETLTALREVNAQAERAGRIMGSILNFTRRNEPQRQQVDVNEMVRDVASFIDLKAERSEARVEYGLCEQPVSAVADPILIEQVILNIAFNGIEAMAGTAPGRRVLRITTDRLPRAVRISVEDNGHGLPRMNPDQIFDAFYTTKKEGLGIGLALCRTIVDSHAGHMWATSGARGTVFHVALPIEEEKGGHA